MSLFGQGTVSYQGLLGLSNINATNINAQTLDVLILQVDTLVTVDVSAINTNTDNLSAYENTTISLNNTLLPSTHVISLGSTGAEFYAIVGQNIIAGDTLIVENSLTAGSIVTPSIYAGTGSFANLIIGEASFSSIYAGTGTFTNLFSGSADLSYITTSSITGTNAQFNSLTGGSFWINSLGTQNITGQQAYFNYITTSSITGANAQINSLTGGTFWVTNLGTQNITGQQADFNYLNNTSFTGAYIYASSMSGNTGYFNNLYGGVGEFLQLNSTGALNVNGLATVGSLATVSAVIGTGSFDYLTANTGTVNELMVNNTVVVDGIATFNAQPLSWEGYGVNASYINASSTGYFNGLVCQKTLTVGNTSDSQIWFNGNLNGGGNYGHNMLELWPGGSAITAQNIYGLGMASGEMQYNIDAAGSIHRFLCDGISQGTIGNGSKWITSNNTLDDGSGNITAFNNVTALKNINAISGALSGGLSIGTFLTSLQGVSPIIQNQQPLNVPLAVGYNYSPGLTAGESYFTFLTPAGGPSVFRFSINMIITSYTSGTLDALYEYTNLNSTTASTVLFGSGFGLSGVQTSLSALGDLNYPSFNVRALASTDIIFKTQNSGSMVYDISVYLEQLTNSQ